MDPEAELFDDGDEDNGDEAGLGPDERDRDLMDGSWEDSYYAGDVKTRDWNTIIAGVSLIVLIAITIPMLLVLFG